MGIIIAFINAGIRMNDSSIKERVDYINSNANAKRNFYKKLSVIVVALLVAITNSIFGWGLPYNNPECLSDKLFNITYIFNRYFYRNGASRNFILIYSSLLIDICGFSFFTYLLVYKSKVRPFFALTLIYGSRFIFQLIFLMKHPEGLIWQYPGFPSAMVSYHKTNDYFYSGHVCTTMYCFLEFRHEKFHKLAIFALFTSINELVIL